VTKASRRRDPLGPVKSRQLLSARYERSLPGVPDGEYVVIQYATSFEKKATATATVTPMKDGDGQWRVSGYYIR
jgi:predicted SnoaL-like aldol condensation-catalyzing enzyme